MVGVAFEIDVVVQGLQQPGLAGAGAAANDHQRQLRCEAFDGVGELRAGSLETARQARHLQALVRQPLLHDL